LAFLLLHSLPKNTTWENFTASVLGSLPDGDILSFRTVSNRLTAEDVRHHSNAGIKFEAALNQLKQKPKVDKWCSHHSSASHNTDDCFTLKKLKQDEENGGKSGVDKRKLKSRGHEKAHKAKGGSEYDSDASESEEEQAHVTTILKRCIGAYLGENLEKPKNGILMDSGVSTTM
ncbi:hypothetical protein M422DRAFT_118899, partial [Sphaerobolus stellatus SS14]